MFSDMVYAMTSSPGGGEAPQGAAGLFSSFLPLIIIFAIFYFLLIRPQSKKAKEQKDVLASLKKGDKVITSGGIHGLIDDIDGGIVTLKVGIKDDVRIKVDRNFIAGIRKEG
jgi:preprotein translocase subunit YajC